MLPGLDEGDGPVPGGQNLRQMILGKFSMPTTAAAATSAVEELKQETQETVDSFYERTRFAVDKLLFSVAKTTPEEKQMYQNLFQTQVYIFFKAGLLPNYRTKIFSAAGNQIPTTAVALLEAARNAEREENAGKKLLLPKEYSTSKVVTWTNIQMLTIKQLMQNPLFPEPGQIRCWM